ncbi:DNA-binding domain superfamily [Sesbania bispinosa]|nr:DNA-binding domain superfamily [Sesbania bispinosa]
MSRSSGLLGTNTNHGNNKFKGVRRRKWGKWVSEIRVPGTQERLWLGTYATPEAAAVAHDVAVYYLRKPSTLDKLNFPETLSSYCLQQRDMSPSSVQKVASDVAMDVDARNISGNSAEETKKTDDDIHNGSVAEQVFWWEDLGSDDCETWEGLTQEYCRQQGEEEALSISIEDYL